jgi:hypothetical protein
MRGKLIKTRDNGFLTYVLKGEDKRTIAMTRYPFPSESIYLAKSHGIELQKLSPENCDEIFGVVDIDKLVEDSLKLSPFIESSLDYTYGYIDAFYKHTELNKDKVFTLDDMKKAINLAYVIGGSEDTYQECEKFVYEQLQPLQQPTEIEVEIEMKRIVDETKVIGVVKGVKGSGDKIKTYKTVPKLDSNGCLILKKI